MELCNNGNDHEYTSIVIITTGITISAVHGFSLVPSSPQTPIPGLHATICLVISLVSDFYSFPSARLTELKRLLSHADAPLA